MRSPLHVKNTTTFLCSHLRFERDGGLGQQKSRRKEQTDESQDEHESWLTTGFKLVDNFAGFPSSLNQS
jgi:hypothetical protein